MEEEITEHEGLYKIKGTPWTQIGCVVCGEIHAKFNLFLHDDHPGGILSICNRCNKIYFLQSDVEATLIKE
jgi:hypothetical protein